MSDIPLLEIDNASKIFHLKPMLGVAKEVVAMRNVSLSVKKGRALAIVGESGSGKSTIGRSVTRLFQLSEGEIRFKARISPISPAGPKSSPMLGPCRWSSRTPSPPSIRPTPSATTSNGH